MPMKIVRVVALSLCLAALASNLAYAGWDVSAEIGRIVSEAPPLVSFPEAEGMVWKRDLAYSLAADGSLTRSQKWLVLAGPFGLPSSWRHWILPIAPGGQIDVFEAGLYDPVTSRLVLPLLPVTKEEAGLSFVELRLPPETADLVLALEFREILPRRYNVDDRLWTNADLPLWEGEIAVDVPEAAGFVWTSSEGLSPSKTTEKGRDSYAWRLVNRPAWKGGGLVADGRPSLAFSLRRGLRSSLEELGPLSAGLDIALPSALATSSTNVIRRGEALLGYVDGEARLRRDLPANWVRPPERLPAEGPWTEWERTLLLSRWLAAAGWKCDLFWQPLTELDDAVPATRTLWLRPVLSLSAPGLSQAYYLPGQAVPLGETPSEIRGKTLYRLDRGNVVSVSVPGGEALENRLILTWRLSVDEKGFASGDLVVDVFGGWFSLVGAVSSRGIEGLALRGSPLTLGEPEVARRKAGLRVTYPVRGGLGIPGNASLLLQVPGVDPRAFSDLRRGLGPLSLQFPFVFEQAFEITLPQGYRPLDFPTRRNVETGPVRLTETFREKKKAGSIEGSSRLVVTTSALDDGGAATLAALIQRGDQWSALTLPVRKR